MSDVTFDAKVLVDGEATAPLLVCTSEIPGWGSIDPKTGNIIENGHPQFGKCIAGKVLVMPGAKGASGWSGQFHIAKLLGNAPAAVVTKNLNTKLALGLAVMQVPALMGLPADAYEHLHDDVTATVAGGRLTIHETDDVRVG